MTPSAAGDGGSEASGVDPEGLVSSAVDRLAAISTSAALDELQTDLLGKRSALARAHQSLVALDPGARPEAGRRLNEARRQIETHLADARRTLESDERSTRLQADRLDLTEVIAPALRGRLHVVQRTRDELEDVFVGMGFRVAEGPEAETDWYNFEALNMPPAHPARGMWDTLYLELGEPETVMLRTHTSPVQVRLMKSQGPPIFAVMPGKCYRRDTPDARHIPTFHQIEGLVVDRGISFADLAGTIEAFTSAYFGPDIHSRLATVVLPVHRALGGVRDHVHDLQGLGMSHVLADGVDRARWLRHGRPGRPRRRRARRGGVDGIRLRVRDRPMRPDAPRDPGHAGVLRQRRARPAPDLSFPCACRFPG